jgi:hypothetical protein
MNGAGVASMPGKPSRILSGTSGRLVFNFDRKFLRCGLKRIGVATRHHLSMNRSNRMIVTGWSASI